MRTLTARVLTFAAQGNGLSESIKLAQQQEEQLRREAKEIAWRSAGSRRSYGAFLKEKGERSR